MKNTIVLNQGFAALTVEELVNNMNTKWFDLNGALNTVAVDTESGKTYEFEIVDGKAVAVESALSVESVVAEHERQEQISNEQAKLTALADRMGREIIGD